MEALSGTKMVEPDNDWYTSFVALMQDLRDGAVDAKNQAEAARDDAARSAELAQQAANNNGFAALEIDSDGNLQLTRTENLANKLDFAIVEDNLEVTIYG